MSNIYFDVYVVCVVRFIIDEICFIPLGLSLFTVRIAEHGFFQLDSLSDRPLTARRGRHLCAAHARAARKLSSTNTQSVTAFDYLFLVSVTCRGCQCCHRIEPSKSDSQVVTNVKEK